MGQNYYPYPIPNGVYTPAMFQPNPSPPHSPITQAPLTPCETEVTPTPTPTTPRPTAPNSANEAVNVESTAISPIRITEFVMKNGNFTPVYDQGDLKKYCEKHGLPKNKWNVPEQASVQYSENQSATDEGTTPTGMDGNTPQDTAYQGQAPAIDSNESQHSSRQGGYRGPRLVSVPVPFIAPHTETGSSFNGSDVHRSSVHAGQHPHPLPHRPMAHQFDRSSTGSMPASSDQTQWRASQA